MSHDPQAPLPAAGPPTSPGALAWTGLVGGLVCSGVAGIVNQVVWQRALKIFLGGSETLSSMIVVLVFLLGLGLGAALASGWAARVKNPMRALAGVEMGLMIVTALVAVVLGLDLSETVYGVQRVAVAAGLPLRGVYAVGAGLVLLPPTLLMGATLPLASEAAQRQLGATNTRLVPLLFFVNTAGAAAGALLASLWWLPWYGQTPALLRAVALNAAAALLLLLLARRPNAAPQPRPAAGEPGRGLRFSREEWLGFVLGFLSLGYEMLLFRSLVLSHGPLPVTFAAGLCAFLVAWSLGVAMAGRVRRGAWVVALVSSALAIAMPTVLPWGVSLGELSLPLGAALMVLPVVGFGLLYGILVSRRAARWGRDVGRYAALNTVGSCLGVLFFTLAGYEAPQLLVSWTIGLCLLSVALVELYIPRPATSLRGLLKGGAVMAPVAALGVLAFGWLLPWTEEDGARVYWGRDGVVAIQPNGDVLIDGLWHTRLTVGDDHVGRPYTWTMAAAAALAHHSPAPERALVIGAGVGVSAVSLAGVEGLQVDGYEINDTLKRVLEDMPDQTLGALEHPSLRWIWQDARTGLALDETRYDIILSAPLQLKQAGSSLLLSREYFRLVKSRLKPGGVLAVYSNEGVTAQSMLVQRTLSEVFRHRISFLDGIVTVATDHPEPMSLERFAERMERGDRLYQEMRQLDQYLRSEDSRGVVEMWDGAGTLTQVADRAITDDWPLVEYPDVAARLVSPVNVETVRRE